MFVKQAVRDANLGNIQVVMITPDSEPAPPAEGYAPRADPGCLATELEPDSELERVFDGDEGGGDDALDKYIDGVVADDALGDWEMGVSSGAHGGAGF